MPKFMDKSDVLSRRKSPRLNDDTPIKLTPNKLVNKTKLSTPPVSKTALNKKNSGAKVQGKLVVTPSNVKPAPSGVKIQIPSSVQKRGSTMSQTSSESGESAIEVPMVSKSACDEMLSKFLIKVDEDRKIVIDEMKSMLEGKMKDEIIASLNTMEGKMKDEIIASLNTSLQNSIASLRKDIYTELESKFGGELIEIRNDIKEIKSRSDFSIDDDKLNAIEKRLDDLENRDNSKFAAECLKEFEERLSRRKNVMIYGVPESKMVDGLDRKKEDLQCIEKLVNELSISFDVASVNCRRMGKFSRNLARARPLKVFCYSIDKTSVLLHHGSRKSVTDASKLLKGRLFLPDQTDQQRAQYGKLSAELTRRRVSEKNPGLKILYVNGNPVIVYPARQLDSSTVPLTPELQ